MIADKRADLAGPGIGTYEEIERILPQNYASALDLKETQRALYEAKDYIEEHLCKALHLMRVQVPLIVDRDSGVNDTLDRDGSRTPVEFPCGLGLKAPIPLPTACRTRCGLPTTTTGSRRRRPRTGGPCEA